MQHDDLLNETAMKIILHAGDARLNCMNALSKLEMNDFDSAEEEMKNAKKNITEAHKVQTDTIQKDMQNGNNRHSLLFTHAQDTLMTIYSEINIANQLIRINKKIDKRFLELEKAIGK